MTITTKAPARTLRVCLAVVGALVALPMGLSVAPALAAPPTVTPVDNGWRGDCDHSGRWAWEQDRGQRRWSDCDHGRGHWEMRDHRWQWHHDRGYSSPSAPHR
ncbi:hypothetical protein KO481_07820 [Nocardia sp. NEAU-G5]|uniref:Secreted protein n=1 Tax=Nocardia albiluteola TaxID=2842303 RepID=A0ABS6ATR9_9NOCA|nr:hypothetical protein [Nocardia albiluteola]MBU3061429.1 hypothetical protein [Nocardia albiluteola]